MKTLTEHQSNHVIRYVVIDVFHHEIARFVKIWPFKILRVLIGDV